MKAEILMGDEAVALGAIHAGIKKACGYPGTPSTEIFEYILDQVNKNNAPIHAQWAANEKVAYEEAMGASFAGCRSIVTMKHVGLNVAADPLMNSSITGVNGGVVVVVADDPSMHSSQNEQDSRYYANFAQILCLEPSNQQECYDMTREAYELSEKYCVPVILRMVTRLAHSRCKVELKEAIEQKKLNVSTDSKQWVLLPANARIRYKKLLAVQPALQEYSESCAYNKLVLRGKKLGVITTGVAFDYLQDYMQQAETDFSYLKINTYPVPLKKIQELCDYVDEVIIIEEGMPFLEEKLRGILKNNYNIHGKLDGRLSRDGELTPESIRTALQVAQLEHATLPTMQLPPRPPALCTGCPHVDLYTALNAARKDYPNAQIFGDIGCYTLGALPPFNAIMTTLDMGASISMAKGAANCGIFPALAVIGDSTFSHSGITSLLGAIRENTNMTVIILDNATVAMTGGQKTMTTCEMLDKLVLGLGVEPEHFKVIFPLPKNLEENTNIIKKEIEYNGLSVIISRRECLQTAKKHAKKGV
jgi:indolepyruvate ferredoxin oxidoreductase alpha subunit